MAQDIAALHQKIRYLQSRLRFIYQRLDVQTARDRQNTALIDRLYDQWESLPPRMDMTRKPKPFDGITFIVAAYNIPRQIRRTVMTCGHQYQNASKSQIEVIIVDNGSKPALKKSDFKEFPQVSTVMRVTGKPSPVHGLNAAIKKAKFNNVALLIDGAHMLSPGVFNHAKTAIQSHRRPVINVPQYMLGTVSQNLKPPVDAFDVEEADLAELNWPNDGYALFQYALYAGEDRDKNIYMAGESNCLISTKEVFEKDGAFDERFDEPGAGFANLEMFERLTSNPENKYIILPGEGSFHQDHDGTTTKPAPSERQLLVDQYREKYKSLTGKESPSTRRPPFTHGNVPIRSYAVPTISREFNQAKNKILSDLANIYIMRAQNGEVGPVPHLVGKKPTHEHVLRPTLNALGLRDKIAKKRKVESESLNYLKLLERMHAAIQPKLYFEVGVNTGESLALSRCFSIGVDPASELKVGFEAPTRMYREESDKFFAKKNRCENLFKSEIDFAFLDGMHLSEFIVRDFLNTERYMAKDGVIVIDDIYPEQIEMAGRPRPFNAWCGDVYIIIRVLQKYRPDLKLDVFEGFIGPYRKGIVMITNLDPDNRDLDAAYPEIEADIAEGKYDIESIEDLDEFMPVVSTKTLEKTIQKLRG